MDEDPNWYIKSLVAKPFSLEAISEITYPWFETDQIKHFLFLLQQALSSIQEPIPQIRILRLTEYFLNNLDGHLTFSQSASEITTIKQALNDLTDSFAIPSLVQQLHFSSLPLQLNAARALGLLKAKSARLALEGCLNDPSHKLRMTATYAIAQIADSKSIPALMRIVNDENEWVRTYVAIAFGRIGSSDVLTELTSLNTDPKARVRRAALSALGRLKISEAIPYFTQGLNDPQDSVKIRALQELYFAKDTSTLEHVLPLCNHENPEVRRSAVDYLGLCPMEIVFKTLLKALDDPDEVVQINALMGLGRARLTDAIPALISCLDSENLSGLAVDYLGYFPSPQILLELLHRFATGSEEESFWYEQRCIEKMLKKLLQEECLCQSDELVKGLLPMLDVPTEDVSASVLEYFSRLTEKEALLPLVQALGSEKTELSKNAATLLLQIGKPAFIPLFEAQQDPNPTIRKKAKLLLGSFQFP